MNKDDKKHIELVDYKIDELKQDISDLKSEISDAHQKTEESLKFIKENLFNPNEGLWAETKLNTQHRESTTKWRTVIGGGFIALLIKNIWEMFTR